ACARCRRARCSARGGTRSSKNNSAAIVGGAKSFFVASSRGERRDAILPTFRTERALAPPTPFGHQGIIPQNSARAVLIRRSAHSQVETYARVSKDGGGLMLRDASQHNQVRDGRMCPPALRRSWA